MGVLRNGKRKGETRLKGIESRARSATLSNMAFVWSFVPEAANNRSEHTSQKPHKQDLTIPPRCSGKMKRNMGTCLVHARLAPPHHHVKPHRVVRHFTPGTPAHFHADDHCHVSGTECGLHRGPESFCRFCTDPGFSPLACPSPVLDTQCSSHSFWSSLVRRSSITRSYRASKAATTSLTTASSSPSACSFWRTSCTRPAP